jgi:hypothetical protein
MTIVSEDHLVLDARKFALSQAIAFVSCAAREDMPAPINGRVVTEVAAHFETFLLRDVPPQGDA